MGAWERLREDVSSLDGRDGLKEMERILCEGRFNGDDTNNPWDWKPEAKDSEKLWIPSSKLRRKDTVHTKRFPFMAKYLPKLTNAELNQRKQALLKHQQSHSSLGTRMQWGNAQEATSILTALNYFCGVDERTTVREVGMCGAGFDDKHDEFDNNLEIEKGKLNGLRIGASPDAIICHGNGTIEVLEVKNHCPFVLNNHPLARNMTKATRHGHRKKKHHPNRHNNKTQRQKQNEPEQQDIQIPKHYAIRDFQLEQKIPPLYIPQLMMEMLCLGDAIDLDHPGSYDSHANDKNNFAHEKKSYTPICKSAVMVRQTATKGAILLRLHRDEEWIGEMKVWLGKFKTMYVDTGVIPPDNFFWENDNPKEQRRYHQFLQRTKELSESVEHVVYIDHGKIQRAVMERGVGGEVPLFLDGVEEKE